MDELVDQAGRTRFVGTFEGAAAVTRWLAGDAPDWNDDAEGGGGILWQGGLVPLRLVAITGDGNARGWSMLDRRAGNQWDPISPELMLEVFDYLIANGGFGSSPGPPQWGLDLGNTAAIRAAIPALGEGDGTGDPFAL